ncbi:MULTISPECIES: TonB-dependent receptor domain-containing protein [unclassified Microbulbifer]|uniref:TonB-dependent receptor plug domain-containing protein n=1 Tax=unclassified Microbulbifer TaxID=2619833 RepID=UPI0027E57C01|nr:MULTISPECIES: TonB-dependent receptor [unclassified Microbulbifer]
MNKSNPDLFKMSALALAVSSTLGVGAPAFSQEDAYQIMEEVAVTGSRGRPRTVSDSPVPVDVFNSDTIEEVAYTDTNDVLKTLVPSYNVSRQPINDGSTFIRPAQLRGMPTDKTLVLVNSKRRHRAALVEIGGAGTQGPDIATIPTAALKSVEVLRDGAAAQYGSDAIAGVINFILKDNSEGGSLTVEGGDYSEGDGAQTTIQGNWGLALGANGFLSLSGEWSEADATERGEQYCEPWFCLDQSNPVYDSTASYTAYTEDEDFMAATAGANVGPGDHVQPWGQPNSEATRLFFNSGYELGANSEFYAFGNYSRSEADGSFYYRYPGNGTIEDLREADGSIYSPLEKFPGGFTPRFFGEVYDYSLVAGWRGEFGSGLSYDFSARSGNSEVEYTLVNTVNPSMGPDSPTSFRPGDLINEEMQVQADFSYEIGTDAVGPVLLAFGASYLDESYEIVEGEETSYVAGPYAVTDPWDLCNDDGTATVAGLSAIGSGSSLNCADPEDPVYQVVGVGSNGFPGYSPEYSGTYSRDSYAAYLDISADVTDRLFLQGALRYEDYSDFDSEVVGKLAGKLSINENFGIRSSIGTGFRAPTPGQQGTTNVSTRLPNGLPVATGLFPASSDVALALGSSPLEPETSTNYTLGFTSSLGELDVTVDFYHIAIEDRTYAISTLDVSTDPSAGDAYNNYLALVGAGVSGAETIGGVFYFANAFDTVTEGVDIVATYPLDWSNGSSTTLTASLNYNTTEFDSDPSEFLNEEDQFDFENLNPNWRGVFTARHSFGDLSLMARANYYGSYENSNAADDGLAVQEFDPVVMVDIEGSYQFNEMYSLAVGGRNIFDEYPEKDELDDYCCGASYPTDTAVSWQGSFYYLRLNADF